MQVSRKLRSPIFFVSLASIISIIPLLTTNPYVLHLFIVIFMYITLAGSYNIITGYTGYTCFGHVAFFGLGAYTAALLATKSGVPIYLTFLPAGFMAVLIAILFGYPCLKLRGPYFSIATLGLNEVARIVILNWDEVTGGPYGVTLHKFIPPTYSKIPDFYMFMIVMIITILASYMILASKFGLGLVAIREAEEAAEVMGVPTTKYKVSAFATSAFFAGVVGALYAWYMFYIDPPSVFDLGISITYILMAVFGGMGTVAGPIIGGATLVLASEALRTSLVEIHAIVYGALLVIVMLFMPGGVMELIRRRFRAKTAM